MSQENWTEYKHNIVKGDSMLCPLLKINSIYVLMVLTMCRQRYKLNLQNKLTHISNSYEVNNSEGKSIRNMEFNLSSW